jgi:hypothetical protein
VDQYRHPPHAFMAWCLIKHENFTFKIIKVDPKGILQEAVDWIHLASTGEIPGGYLVQTVISLRILQNAGSTLTSWTTISFSIWTLINGVGNDVLSQNKNTVNMYLLSTV